LLLVLKHPNNKVRHISLRDKKIGVENNNILIEIAKTKGIIIDL